jgi:hypothetical protein
VTALSAKSLVSVGLLFPIIAGVWLFAEMYSMGKSNYESIGHLREEVSQIKDQNERLGRIEEKQGIMYELLLQLNKDKRDER